MLEKVTKASRWSQGQSRHGEFSKRLGLTLVEHVKKDEENAFCSS